MLPFLFTRDHLGADLPAEIVAEPIPQHVSISSTNHSGRSELCGNAARHTVVARDRGNSGERTKSRATWRTTSMIAAVVATSLHLTA
jgi:hypothetical protein